jgi:hypothetical protein
MKTRLLLIILLFSAIMSLSQTDEISKKLNETLETIVKSLNHGDLKALDEIGSFLDDKRTFIRKTRWGTNTTTVRDVCLSILYNSTSFAGLEITDSLSYSEYKKFIKENKDKIIYSEFMRKFTNLPLAKRKCDYNIRKIPSDVKRIPPKNALENYKAEIKKNLETGHYYGIVTVIEKIGELKTPESKRFLIQCRNGKHWGKGKNNRANQIYSAIAYALGHFQDMEAVSTIIDIISNEDVYDIDECIIALAKITNVDLVALNRNYNNIGAAYKKVIESRGTIEQLKEFGYNAMFSYSKSDFKTPVEYYGQLLLDSNSYWWIKYHAIKDILKLKEPSALKYIASQLYQGIHIYNDHLGREEIDIVEIMEKASGVKVEVKDQSGNWATNFLDETSKLHYLIYWYNHYQDYVWNESTQQFENKKDKILEVDRLSFLFEQLKSKNDKTAMKAYIELTQSNLEAVVSKIPQYELESLFGNINDSLPLFLKRFLNQQVYFTHYCRENDIIYLPSKELEDKLNILIGKMTYTERYHLENQLLSLLTIEDLAAIEYYGMLYGSKNDSFSNSAGRILDIYYSDNWNEIVSNSRQLRFYLKKSALFYNLGIIGSCRRYLKKFNHSSSKTLSLLNDLLKKETDEQIKNQVLKVLNHKTNVNPDLKNATSKKIQLQDFLSNLSKYGTGVINAVHISLENTEKDYERIFAALNQSTNKENIRKLLELIRQNLDVKMTPFLIGSIDKKDVVDRGYISRHDVEMRQHSISYDITVSDKIVAFLEYLHQHSFPTPVEPEVDVKFVSGSSTSSAYFRNKNKTAPQWKKLWKSDPVNYSKWGLRFYHEKLREIKSKDSLDIYEINDLFSSRYYNSTHRQLLLNALNKVTPRNYISQLKIKTDTLKPGDLKYFKDVAFEPTEIKNIVKMFNNADPSLMIDYIKSVSSRYNAEQKGEMYYKLLWNINFINWIEKIPLEKAYRNEIISALIAYRNGLRKGSFEIKYANKFISYIRGLDLSLEEKLKMVIKDKSEGAKESAVNILSRASYQELGTILLYYNQLPISDFQRELYLTEDFGIFIPGYSDKTLANFKKNYQAMPEYDLYDFYLRQSKIEYKTEDGTLDYEKIYKILKFDVGEAFVGGSRRKKHVYSVIRLLELTFNTRLGKEQKFNNLINSFGYSTSARAQLWMHYLKEKKLIKNVEGEIPSFSY